MSIRPLCCPRGNHLDSIERAGNPVKCINEVTSDNGNWEKITVTIDSGAVDSVGPKTMATDLPIRDTPASRAGLKYRAVNGTTIDNLGEKAIQGVTKQGNKVGMTFQVADVTKPLGAVRAMLAAGNKVVFESGNSYIQDKTRTMKPPIEERNGAYVFDIWRPKAAGNHGNGVNTGRYHALMEIHDGDNKDFVRQAGLKQ
jgi:hypothetical protein